MRKLKLIIIFGIGFITSLLTSLGMSFLFLQDVTDSTIFVIINAIIILILTALINIPVYFYIVNNK